MYDIIAEWVDQCPITVQLKNGTSFVFSRLLDLHDDCIELVEKDTEDIYLLQKEDILYVKILDSDIPEG